MNNPIKNIPQLAKLISSLRLYIGTAFTRVFECTVSGEQR